MREFLKSHLHPLGSRIIFWNFLLLLFIKLIIPQSAFQLASFIDTIPVFDSRGIIEFTNEARVSNNLPPLEANSALDLAASEKLTDMALEEYFAHISPTGVDPWYWIKKSGYQYSVAGENLAIGFFTAKDTVKAWMNSPSHKANILDPRYKDIGVATKAVEINDQNGILIVQMFGLPTGQPIAPIPIRPTPVLTPSTLEVTQTRGDSIENPLPVIQYVATDADEPVTRPIAVTFEDAEDVREVSDMINNIFSVYYLLIVLASGIAFFLYEKTRKMAVKMSLNAAIFVLSIVIPAAELVFEGLIF